MKASSAQSSSGASGRHNACLHLRNTFLVASSKPTAERRARSEPRTSLTAMKDACAAENTAVALLAAAMERLWQMPLNSPEEEAEPVTRWADVEVVNLDDNQDGAWATSGDLRTSGSFAHPELCSRPCLNFLRGNCVRGSSCGHCHLPHSKRTVHLDKRNRDSLKSLSPQETLDLVAPLVKEKLLGWGLSDYETEVFVGQFALPDLGEETPFSRSSTEGSAASSSSQRRKRIQSLRHTLKALALQPLLATLPMEAGDVNQSLSSLRALLWMKTKQL